MKKLLSLLLSLTLLLAAVPAQADLWSDMIGAAADFMGIDEGELTQAISDVTDFVVTVMTPGFSNNTVAINTAAQSVFQLYSLNSDQGDPYKHLVGTSGSGFLCFNNHLIVTNYHVVDDAAAVLVETDDDRYFVVNRMIAADPDLDIAILYIDQPLDLPVLSYATSGMARGQSVLAIGSGLGIKNSVSKGMISNLVSMKATAFRSVNYVQHSAPINHGNSGGPLFNDNGMVIGVNTMFLDDGEGTAQNVNLAIMMEQVKDLYNTWDGRSLQRLPAYRGY